jgi:hypothetical protein
MPPFPFRSRTGSPAADADLTVCPSCRSGYVIPTDWTAQEGTDWWIRLRCGECGLVREVVVPDAVAQGYDRRLGHGMDEISRVLHRLELKQMAQDAETFATALDLDLLDAGDFVR